MAGLVIYGFLLEEKRIEPTDTAKFSIATTNTFEELDVLNAKLTVSILLSSGAPLGNASVTVGTIGPIAGPILPGASAVFLVPITTTNAAPGSYSMKLQVDYDVGPTSTILKSSTDARPFTIVRD